MKLLILFLATFLASCEKPKVKGYYLSVTPSESYLDSVQKVIPEGDWSEIVFDNEHYKLEAAEYLDKLGYIELDHNLSKLTDTMRLLLVREFLAKNPNNWGISVITPNDSLFLYNGTLASIDLKFLIP